MNTDKLKESIVKIVVSESVKDSHMFQKDAKYFYDNNRGILKFVKRTGKKGVFVDLKTNKTIEREILVIPKKGAMPAEEYIKLKDSEWVQAWFNKVSDKPSLYSRDDEKWMYSGKPYRLVN